MFHPDIDTEATSLWMVEMLETYRSSKYIKT